VPIDDNQCGRYVTTFQLLPHDAGHQLRLRFEGVDSAFTVWVNHREVGYSQGSRNPSEFDITPFVTCPGTNYLHVEVYQRCDGTYIEDQVRPRSCSFDCTLTFSGPMVAQRHLSRCLAAQVPRNSL
jgi:beta-galactosidase